MTIARSGRFAGPLLAALIAATACTSSSGGGPGDNTTPAASSPAGGHRIPSPSKTETRALLHGLRKLHVPHSDDRGKLISHARNVCQQIQTGDKGKALVTYTGQEFGAAKPISGKTANKIVRLVKHSFCGR